MGKGDRKSGRGIVCGIFLVLMACFTLSGCGKKADTVQEGTVYVAQRLVTSSDGGYGLPEGFDRLIVVGDTLYFMQQDSRTQSVNMASLSEDGGIVGVRDAASVFAIATSYIELEEDGGQGLSEEEVLDMLNRTMDAGTEAANQSGSGVVSVTPNKRYACFSLDDYAVDLNGDLYLAVRYSQMSDFQMEDVGCILCKWTKEEEWVYRSFLPGLTVSPESLAVDGVGGLYILTAEGIRAIDGTGQETGVVRTQEYKGSFFEYEKMFGSPDGNVYYLIYENYGSRWRGMQVERDGGVSLRELKGFSGNEFMDVCTEYEGNLYFSGTLSGMLCEYDKETTQVMDVLRWSSSNLVDSCVRTFAMLEGARVLVWYQEADWEGLYLLEETPIEDLQGKEIVVLGALGNTQTASIDTAVIQFNRMSEKYQVILDDYGYSSGGEDGAKVRLDAALVSANPPELLLLSGRELEKDVEKGLLEDLSPYLESSIALDREDFLANALEGYTVGGMLVGIPAEFTLNAIGGRASQVGGLAGWGMEDVYGLAQRYPEQTKLLGAGNTRKVNTRGHLLGDFCSAYYLGQFVDWEKGTCDFDNEEFRKLLQWVGEYGIEEEETPDSSGRIYITTAYVTEDTLLMEGSLDFENAALWNIYYDDNIILLGYPTADGRGTAYLSIKAPIGIVAGSDNKEGAWEFLEYYIASVLEGNSGYGNALPTSKSRLRRMLEEAVKQEYINGELKRKYYLSIDGHMVPVYATSREMAEKVMAFIEEADFSPDSALKDIIVSIVLEESESYYAGDKSLKEATEIIQNRVQLILWENLR